MRWRGDGLSKGSNNRLRGFFQPSFSSVSSEEFICLFVLHACGLAARPRPTESTAPKKEIRKKSNALLLLSGRFAREGVHTVPIGRSLVCVLAAFLFSWFDRPYLKS